MVERLHRQLKAALTCHEESWLAALPLVLLGIRSAVKEDLKASAAEILYGEPLRLPGEFLKPHADGRLEDPCDFVVKFRRQMSKLRPIPASRHCRPGSFISRELSNATHVFLRDDAVRCPLTPAYSGPHPVLELKPKTVVLELHGKPSEVSLDRVKPAFCEQPLQLPQTLPPSSSSQTLPPLSPSPSSDTLPLSPSPTPSPPSPLRSSSTPTESKSYTTRSGRKVRFAVPFDL
ncbi:hypothetical protein ABMA28_008221 [Loxostege sticticalis]|uniref:Uncharacterized protein n=1 Tax=Loxostege sticticalis TaxID=481309 RepID=A0ABD0SGE2_LOXSC